MGRFVPQSVTINRWLPDRFQYRIEGKAGLFLLTSNVVALLAVFMYAAEVGGGGAVTSFIALTVLLLVGDINLSYAYESKSTALVLATTGIIVAGLGFMIPVLRLPLPFGFEATFSVIQALALYPLTVITAAAAGFKLRAWHGATDRLLEMGQEKMEEAREKEAQASQKRKMGTE